MKSRGVFHYRYCVSVLALATAHGALAQDAVTSAPEAEPRSGIKPAARNSLTFSVPLVSKERAFGDVLVEVDETGAVSVDTQSLRRELSQLLNDRGLLVFDESVRGRPFVRPAELEKAGVTLKFDNGQLQLAIVSISPELLQVRSLGPATTGPNRIDLPTIEPARFSTYLNVTSNIDYDTRVDTDAPDFFFDGATRIGGVTLEYEGALSDQFTESYKFSRRSTRAVYDDPESYRRYSAGDVRLNTLSILRNPQIGGIAIEKSRQLFDPSYSVTRLAGRQIFLDNRSSVDVLINGAQYDSFQLEAGTYDLASLPIQQGANNVQLLIRDSFGQEEIIDYNFFFEPLTLPAGQEEYSFGLGFLSQTLSFQPDYSGDIAASGYFRKAFSQNLMLGAAAQLAEDVQLLGFSMTAVPQFVPGVVDFEVAGSRSDGETGFSVRAGYRYQMGSAFSDTSQLAINVDYQTEGFNTIDNLLPINFDLLTVSATYSRSFSRETFATVGGSYVKAGSRADDYNLFFDVNHRINDRLRVTLGAEYGQGSQFRSKFGIRAGLTMALGRRTRATADYNSRLDALRANISRGADNEIGSFGYDVSISKFGDDTQTDLQLEYVANRFEARADFTSAGRTFGRVFDDQRARLQVGTSFAYADGVFGVGRPISNSFLLAKPHPALEDKGIVTARTLNGGAYYARSGALGAAVQGDLSPYSEQGIQYDAAEPADGFDVGDGTIRVLPPYKSGYRLTVGSEHFVSAIGILTDAAGPVALATGRVSALDLEEQFEPLPFFTNSKGRFGLFGLAPGKRYQVELSETGRTFIIEVPEDSDAVLRIDNITLPSEIGIENEAQTSARTVSSRPRVANSSSGARELRTDFRSIFAVFDNRQHSGKRGLIGIGNIPDPRSQ